MKLDEVIDDSYFPILDDRGEKGLELAFRLDQSRLVAIGHLDQYNLAATVWPPNDHTRIFVLDGNVPVGLIDLFEKKGFQTKYVYFRPEYRRQGLGFKLYAFLLEQGISLVSDYSHTRDSIALWQKLARDPRFRVTHDGIEVNDTNAFYNGIRSHFVATLRSDRLDERAAIQPWNPKGVDPSLLTFQEYLALVNPGDKWHPEDAYDHDGGFAEWDGRKDEFKLLRRVKIRGIEFEFRIKIDKLHYAKRDANDDFVRQDGQVVYHTDQEVAEKGLQPHDFVITVWTPREGERCIGATQDEWGAMLVRVQRDYRGFGLGTLLIKLARSLEPNKQSGGFTGSGYANFVRAHREFVRDAIASGKYSQLVRAGKITMARVREIIDSVDLSKRPEKRSDLSSNDPRNWVMFADDYGAFIIYDRKLREVIESDEKLDERFVDSMVKAYLYVAISDGYARVKKVTGDPKLKTFLYAAAHALAREDGATLYVEEEDADIVGFKLGPPDYKAGYKARPVLDGPVLDWRKLANAERKWRASFDRYDEFKNRLYEIAERI